MKLTKKQLRQVINEELARGIPDYAFTRPVDSAISLLTEDLIRILVAHINQTSTDPVIRNKRYAAANRVAAALRRDREFTKILEDKLKEKLLLFFDESR
jgi:hypothetical protein